ncbi:2582_t:CDS:1, partial [Ambispora leptoticha]
ILEEPMHIELPDMDIHEEPMHINSLDNNSDVSSCKKDFSFIAKSQSKKGKKSVENERRRGIQNHFFVENFFSNKKDVIEDLLDNEDYELSDQEINR